MIMSDDRNASPRPGNLGDLKLEPPVIGGADLEAGYLEAALEGAAADPEVEVGGVGARNADADAVVPTEGGRSEEESAAQPS